MFANAVVGAGVAVGENAVIYSGAIIEHDSRIGIRIPVGLAYLVESEPLDVFVEIVPLLDLAPDTEFDLNASVGARYFFR